MSVEAILVAFMSCLVGGIAGPLFQQFLDSAKASNSASVENSHIGVNNQTVTSTTTNIVINDYTIFEAGRTAREGPGNTYFIDNVKPFYAITAFIMLSAVIAVNKFESKVELGLLSFACAATTFTLSVMLWTLAHRGRFDGSLPLTLFATFCGCAVAILDAILLRRDPLADLRSIQRGELAIWKLIGIALTAALLCVIVLVCLKLIALTNFAANARSRSWARLVVWGGSIGRAVTMVCILGLISIAFTSNVVSSRVGIDKRPPHPYGPLNVPNVHPTNSPVPSPTH